jgi:hypothetical protein
MLPALPIERERTRIDASDSCAHDLARNPDDMRSVMPPRPGPTGPEGGDDPPRRVGDRATEDRALFARYLDSRDPVDRELLVERFLPLARQLARRYQRPEEPT